MSAAVIRPGDHVILSAPVDVDQESVAQVKQQLEELFPQNGFTVLAGLRVEAVLPPVDASSHRRRTVSPLPDPVVPTS